MDATRVFRSAEGNATRRQTERRPSDVREGAISTEVSRSLETGRLTIAARLSHKPVSFDTERFGFVDDAAADAPTDRTGIRFTRKADEGEISARWSQPRGNDWSLNLMALSSLEKLEQSQIVAVEQPLDTVISASQFDIFQDSFESILRATIGRRGERRIQPEFGAEVAYNRLDSDLTLMVTDASGTRNILLPAANVRVEELRSEAFANIIWKASERLNVETGIALELSQITVSGDADSSQSFFFAKPFMSLIYAAHERLQFRLGLRRTVGQLDFSDFAASASAADDRLTAGNPTLEPDQTTRASLSVDWRSARQSAFNLEVFHEWRDDVLELSLLPSGGQGLANVGSARVWGATGTASLPLGNVIPGGLLELEAEVLDSSFDDPLLGRERGLSSIDSPTILAEFRQDLSKSGFSWGLSYRAELDGLFYFVDEQSYNLDGEKWTLFFETSRFFGVKTLLEFSGIGGQDFFRERTFYDPTRADNFVGSESISRHRGMAVSLRISGQF